MATMNVSLPDQMKEWVERQVASGRYGNASDYVRDLVRRDQDRKSQIAELDRLIEEGFASAVIDATPEQAFAEDREEFLGRNDAA